MGNEEEKKSPIALREEATLEFWRVNKIFEKTLEQTKNGKEFIFYDGPPFATGEPHYGHILAGTIKDAIPRYKTMRGFHVPRRWGWDCHGLPVENLVEKELGLATRKAVEEYGLEKFNAAAKASVLRYDAVWKKIVPRTGRFVDMDDAYLTMDWRYTESIWWSFKRLQEKGLIYRGLKPMHLCPHDETTLSNLEVALNYKELTDISVYVKFELVEGPGTFLLAWTTTPWTLPDNTALAVNADVIYVRARVETKEGSVTVILAKERLGVIKDSYTIEEEFLGAKLVGKKYKPVFPYYLEFLKRLDAETTPSKKYTVVAADFVTTTDGTGIVHIAPAFGEDDYELGLKEGLPAPQFVGMDGRFTKDVTDFVGLLVKPKPTKEEPDANQKTDIEIIKYLAKHGALFAKEKIKHSYPCCWRCDTPLLNYATTSWFVKVTDLKEKLVAENQKVKWVPTEIGEGRFGDWLKNAKDWAVSRSRFWGAPLPVWICEKCNEPEFIGSVAELAGRMKRNTYFVMRHGQAESNVANIVSVNEKNKDPLTATGRKQVVKAAEKLVANEGAKIDFIFSSPFERTRETAELVAETLGYKGEIMFDDRLRELGSFSFEGKSRSNRDVQYTVHSGVVPAGDETKELAAERVKEFFYDIDAKYVGKTILVVSHAGPLLAFGHEVMENAQVRKVPFSALPHDANFTIDLHRPFVDAAEFPCAKCGGVMHRVPDVFDTWYESGSMPFASVHFPFEHGEKNQKEPSRFPANFIAEGQDQTRGWFYSLLVLGCGLFGQSPYQNVVVNGIILDETGRQKLSKKLKNYPDISLVLNKYGADAMRYYLLSSPVVKAEDLAFSEKGLDEVVKKISNRLDNVYAFYALYSDGKVAASTKSKNILDRWILARLAQVGGEVTDALERYELDKATRPFGDFLDDLSTWYIRRSRDRFKGENAEEALATTRFVLEELAKLLAPFMPFAAEDLYQKVKSAKGAQSVHLETWPEFKKADEKLLTNMVKARMLVSLALEARAAAGIKIRQPLSTVTVGREGVLHPEFQDELYELMRDELNVKKIVYTSSQTELVTLDTIITPELRLEGVARDLIRFIQELRKKKGLLPSQDITLTIATSPEGRHVLKMFMDKVKNITRAKELVFAEKLSAAEKISIENFEFSVSLE